MSPGQTSSDISLLGLEELRRGKNLLAFSGGSDSSALFFLLLEQKIPFDIAIVDYGVREESGREVAYALELGERYGKRVFQRRVSVERGNFEAEARTLRYRFFEEIIEREGYTHLLTAHQLNDLLEWFMMQFAKGAGCVELIGMEPISLRSTYKVVRPLLLTPKGDILRYLETRKITYFQDRTNWETTYLRNAIRHTFTDSFIERYAAGVARTFTYLLQDRETLLKELPIYRIGELSIAPFHPEINQRRRLLLQTFKALNYIPSTKQIEEIWRSRVGVLAGKFGYGIDGTTIMIAPFVSQRIPKTAREEMRRARIPPPLRGYLYRERLSLSLIGEYRDRARNWLQSYRQLFSSPEGEQSQRGSGAP
ncbi:MAG: tRNA lysidine(34) synthetase TilS [Epsilonproteobacteria bacterium]|nr:tRNA lysidine(34) synthetase TilS [Campylobacterota bacterium]